MWQFSDGSTAFTTTTAKQYTAPGGYQVNLYVTGVNGCRSDTAIKFVTVYPNPIIDMGADIATLENNIVTLKPQVSGGGLSFLWTPPKYLSSTTVQSPLAVPIESITYRLTVSAIGGCTATDTVHVKVLKQLNVPNVFSPNGDGINDTWIIRSLADYPGCTVEVFSRYGAPVFSSTGYSTPWDGTLKGSPLPVGTYYYIIDPKNGLPKITGNVTILK